MIDAEKLISKYLRDQSGARLVGKTPDSTDASWVRLTLLDAPSVGGHRSDHLIEAYVQLDCYAGKTGGQPEANALGGDVRDALADIENHTHEGATVTGHEIRSYGRRPDDSFTPSRERIVLTAVIWMHP